MNLNNNKFLLSTAQPFEQPIDDKPYEVPDNTSKSTASSPLHVGFENTRIDENMKDYAGTNFDGQELGFDSKNTKPSQFNNVYINNSIALNFTSNNIMSHNEGPNMAKKMKVTSSYSNAQKPQTEQFETRICLNCGEKNNALQDTYCPACHSCITGPSKDHYNGLKPGQHEQHMRKDHPWSNYVNLAESQKNENLRITQPKFNSAASASNYDPNSYHFLPQNSQALIHPQVQANHYERENLYFAKQNNFVVYADPNTAIPLPPPPQNTPKLYDGPNYCDESDKLSFRDEVFKSVNKESGNKKASVNKELFDKLDEMDFEGGDAFSFQNGDHNEDDDLDNMDGWQEMDFAGQDESSQEKPEKPVVPIAEGKRSAQKNVEVIELSEHSSEAPESPKSGGLRQLLAKENRKLFSPQKEPQEDEQPVDDLISFFLENSSKKTMLYQKEPLKVTQQTSVNGIHEDSSKAGGEENGVSKDNEVNHLNLLRSKSETQTISKAVKGDNKKAHHKAEKGEKANKEHKDEGQKTRKRSVNDDLLPILFNKVDEHSNLSFQDAEKTEQIVQNAVTDQTKATVDGTKKPFVIQNNPKNSFKIGINLQKTSGSFKKKRQEKEKEKDLEREKERELNWEREHEKERERLKEVERQLEKEKEEKEHKQKHRHREKEHHKEKEKEKEKEHHKEHHKEIHKEIHKENHIESHKEAHKEKEKELHKEKEKEKDKDEEAHKEKETVKEKKIQKEKKVKEKVKEKAKEKEKEKENKKLEAKMVEEKEKEKDTPSEVSSEESEYFMFGEEYDMILECYSQESQFVDVHEVKRRMDDFNFIMKDKEEIENIDEILFPKKTVICIGGEHQTWMPMLSEANPLLKPVCKIWDPDRITRQNYDHFMESLSDITKLPLPNIKEEKAVEILIDNNYSVDQALRFANQYLDYVKGHIVFPQPQPKKQEKEK